MPNQQYVKIPIDHGWLESQLAPSRLNPEDLQRSRFSFSLHLQEELGIVLCHPHPQMGGTMSNHVIQGIYHVCITQNITTLCFNFRGVGDSTGRFDYARGEQLDVKASVEYLLAQNPHISQIVLIGYSFGAVVSAPIAKSHPRVKAYIAISYPFGFFPQLESEILFTKPKLFVLGEQDDFIPSSSFFPAFKEIPEPKSYLIIPGESHFWESGVEPLIKGIFPWIQQVFEGDQIAKESGEEEF